MRKVLHLIETSGPGGAESMLVNHIFALKRHGIESDVLLIKDGWLHKRLAGLGVKCWLVPLPRSFAPGWFQQVLAILRREGYYALHAHEFSMNCHSAVLSLLSKVPAVATVHGKNYYADRWQRRLLYQWSARVATFVAVSEDIKQFLADRVGVRRDGIQVVANGIDIAKYENRSDIRASTREQLSVAPSDVLIGAVGNLYPVKGHIHLIRAAATIVAARPNVKFVVAGRGGEQQALQAEIDRLGLQNNFMLLGFREDVDALLQAFDLFVMPSLSEGMPISILEAMAAHRVVIASDVGGIPQLIRQGHSGVLVPPQDPQQLAAAILDLITDTAKRETLVRQAYVLVCERFSQDACTDSYVALYEKRASQRPVLRSEAT